MLLGKSQHISNSFQIVGYCKLWTAGQVCFQAGGELSMNQQFTPFRPAVAYHSTSTSSDINCMPFSNCLSSSLNKGLQTLVLSKWIFQNTPSTCPRKSWRQAVIAQLKFQHLYYKFCMLPNRSRTIRPSNAQSLLKS